MKSSFVFNLEDYDIYRIKGLVKSGNSIMTECLTGNFNAISIDLQNKRSRSFFRQRLNEEDLMVQLRSLNLHDGVVTALDFHKGRLIETTLHPVTRMAGGEAEEIIQLPSGQKHLSALKTSSYVIATGLYVEGRYLFYSLVDQTSQYFLSYPDHPKYPDIKETTKGMLYASSILRIRPDETTFVCGDMYSGLLDFCQITSNGIERIKEVRLHYPSVDISEKPRCQVAYHRNNHFGFKDIAVSQDYVYALYSGKTYRAVKDRVLECNNLLVYDWDGNLVEAYELDAPFCGVTYDIEEGALYGVSCKNEFLLSKFRTPDLTQSVMSQI